jgi:hypothetical protein
VVQPSTLQTSIEGVRRAHPSVETPHPAVELLRHGKLMSMDRGRG